MAQTTIERLIITPYEEPARLAPTLPREAQAPT